MLGHEAGVRRLEARMGLRNSEGSEGFGGDDGLLEPEQ